MTVFQTLQVESFFPVELANRFLLASEAQTKTNVENFATAGPFEAP